MTSQKISIAIAGHTNTGKTTLIRTLMKSTIGDVSDQKNVTKQSTAYYYQGLQADFIDTPGFRYAQTYNMYRQQIDENPEYKLPKAWEEKMNLDLDAIQAIGKSNVVFYVGNLSVVPDETYIEEIEAVVNIQPKVIGILNQASKQLEASNQKIVDNRINLWKEELKKQGVEDTIVFDAHWDKPSKINEIYDAIYRVLNSEEQALFSKGLNEFKNRQKEILTEALSMLANCITEIQEFQVATKKNSFSQETAKNKMVRELQAIIVGFVHDVKELYKVAAEYPTAPKKELKTTIESSANIAARIGWGAGLASTGGVLGAAAGAAIVGAITGLLTGGLGAGAGALFGAQIGGLAGGAFLGTLGALDDGDDIVKIHMESTDIKNITIKFIAIIWGLSNNGYGRERKLSQDEMKNIEDKIKNFDSSYQWSDWKTISPGKVISYCEEILDKLAASE
ncbi:DUF3482 domain-containing protein [Nostoc sp. LEGE 12447]|uniref:GTPase n=1 Tax=Nostoc sp. LEGE 12447 TaxID=1828640 RepID=UPI0018840011|nr:DUF3482 domain-containing protein [Nostoc sp. LEGE 12447]MBE9001683.1 DUF3482 domain-containing protein [Nostoc sp. LEGE 12447]